MIINALTSESTTKVKLSLGNKSFPSQVCGKTVSPQWNSMIRSSCSSIANCILTGQYIFDIEHRRGLYIRPIYHTCQVCLMFTIATGLVQRRPTGVPNPLKVFSYWQTVSNVIVLVPGSVIEHPLSYYHRYAALLFKDWTLRLAAELTPTSIYIKYMSYL